MEALRLNPDHERLGLSPSSRPEQFLVSVRCALRRTAANSAPVSMPVPAAARHRCSGLSAAGALVRCRVKTWPTVARSGLELGDPPLKEAPLALGACECERTLERLARLVGPAKPAQQLPARRVQVLVVAELELLDDLERLLG
jgi:hypothetical protein